jgi:hypothetical protein
MSTGVETNHLTLSKAVGVAWHNLPEEERRGWQTKSKEALVEHKRKYPQYALRPVHTKEKWAPPENAKVRGVEQIDIERCTMIAQLLVKGKKGAELNAAVEEFDRLRR